MSRADVAVLFYAANDEWLEKRFWPKVGPADPVSGCRLWLASRSAWGYGLISAKLLGRPAPVPMLAHRVSWAVEHGGLPERGSVLMHLCRTNACVEPSHLESVAPYLVQSKRRLLARD
jgi:hypothetical protein